MRKTLKNGLGLGAKPQDFIFGVGIMKDAILPGRVRGSTVPWLAVCLKTKWAKRRRSVDGTGPFSVDSMHINAEPLFPGYLRPTGLPALHITNCIWHLPQGVELDRVIADMAALGFERCPQFEAKASVAVAYSFRP